jgi:Helix-turn-helix of DDE superfamily endonuclease
MQDRTIDGQPRTSRRYRTYKTCPLPTTADKLLFILTSVTQHPSQEVQGQLFGMSQSNAHKWIQLLHPVLNQALADQERLPARTAAELTMMLTTPSPDPPSLVPRCFMLGPNAQSSVQKPLRSRKSMTVGRRNATRSQTSW